MLNGSVSHWWAAAPPERRARLAPDRPIEADVAIVGAGYTGLWTAWYLKEADPSLRIVLLEREHAGFGASGRNGGWLSGLLAGSRERWAKEFGRDAVVAAQRQAFATVDEVEGWTGAQGVDCDLVRGGSLDVATSAPALERIRAAIAYQREWGFGEEDWRELTAGELGERIAVEGARGATFTPHCARIDPVKLVRGLAEAVVRAGVELYEDTPVTAIEPGVARTPLGDVRARWVVRATEGFTHGLAPRQLIPMNSAMIVTPPLDAATWERIGWDGCETLHDAAHVYCYLQRTADGRIAIGGRGIPYRYGSRTDRRGEVAERDRRAARRAPAQAVRPRDRAGARVGRRPGRRARLVPSGHGGQGFRARFRRGVRRPRRRDREPRSAHPARPAARARLGARPLALGATCPAPLGVRAAALHRRALRVRALPAGRPARGAHRAAVAIRRSGHPDRGPLTV